MYNPIRRAVFGETARSLGLDGAVPDERLFGVLALRAVATTDYAIRSFVYDHLADRWVLSSAA